MASGASSLCSVSLLTILFLLAATPSSALSPSHLASRKLHGPLSAQHCDGLDRRTWLRTTLTTTTTTTTAVCGINSLAVVQPALADDLAQAIFSGGDYRYFQPAFEKVKYLGVKSTTAGLMTRADEGIQSVLLTYDPAKVTYKQLLGVFWRAIDPTRAPEEGQFNDKSTSFGAVVWASDASESDTAEESARRLGKSGLFKSKPIRTDIRSMQGWTFVAAGDEEQRWAAANPKAYEAGLKKTQRAPFFQKTYDPITVTACEGKVCGYVYFPCSDDNGCMDVLKGTWK